MESQSSHLMSLDILSADLTHQLQIHLEHVAQERDPYWSSLGHQQVQRYIQAQLGLYGTISRHSFLWGQQQHSNLILNIEGTTSKRPILIGAHYDAVPGSPGADDNATGVAVLLELARYLSAKPARYPVQLVAFDLEEVGLKGSQAYATHLKQKRQPLRLMISLEMLGYTASEPGSQRYPAGLERFYPDRGNFIALIGNLPTLFDMIGLQRQMKRNGSPCEWLPAGQRGDLVPATRRSDHASFWDQGYAAMMITDTSFLRNPHYHLISDRIETLDLDFLTCVCQGLLQFLWRL